jgi:lysophospholipase L1-like esterase
MRALASIALLAGLAGCAATDGRPGTVLSPGARYVAMGSSFAAGAGIGQVKPGTPERCSRTVNNYASLLASRLNLALDDQGCGGATTAHILGPWNELPAQADALTADTRLVTITIGGNDLNYIGNLFMAGCDPKAGFTVQGRTLPCQPPRLPGEAAYAGLETSLRAIAAQVRKRAPQARLVFVQYVTLVPDVPCADANLPADKAALLRGLGERLAAITARVAKETGSLLLPADQLSRRHTPCDAQPWARGLPPGFDGKGGAPWHPNAAGHAALADALAKLLG